ncbi:calcium/proton exchanger [Leptolyngbya sp. O-77]|uniref:calcium/proton exchanger n=1 Tax=Leptolyngbya sp. O-77 TaxID=1080068 RepID=UPI00074D3076|nr:calcium/proton exchanger [Leptolyngbya sp. O-77]BAU42579.1 Putative cation exchanger YfkE [Leptolyngbya sp. O-77]
MLLKRFPALVLLVFIPISLLAHGQDWGDAAVFVTSALAIAPLAVFLSRATEELALALGPTVGGLMNAVFGNATELIISLAALRQGLVDLVKASITGSILGDLLLVLGLAMLLGGLKYKEQSFEPIVVRVNGSSMTLAVTAIALPTIVINTSHVVDAQDITSLSIFVAVVLMLVYGLTLVFSLKTHSYLYDVCKAKQDPLLLTDEVDGRSPLWVWVVVLLLATAGIAIESELFVGVVEEVIADWALTPLFTGVVLLPLLGDVSGYVTAVRVAMKNNMDLPVSVAMGSSLLVALFVAPVLVLVGQAVGQPMDLDFNPFEVSSVAIAVFIVNLISLNGRSNWLDGTLLLATYAILAAAFYYHPA